MHELQAKLGVKAPTYVMITKSDLMAGFNETFDAFSKEQRDQVWGFTFGRWRAGPTRSPRFDADFAALEQRLNSGLFERLAGERDPAKRARMFEFSLEFASLRPVLRDFLQAVFSGGGNLQEDARLARGVLHQRHAGGHAHRPGDGHAFTFLRTVSRRLP